MHRSTWGALLATAALVQLASAQAYRHEAARDIADPYEGFYEELADPEPDADDYDEWIQEELEWDYDQYGPYEGTYSRLNYNYGPYNYLPFDPGPRERAHLLDPPSYRDWNDYWYEIHDREPDLDDYMDVYHDLAYDGELYPPPPPRPPVRQSAATVSPLRAGLDAEDNGRLLAPVDRERTRVYRGRIVDLAALHLIDGRPQSLVVRCETEQGRAFLVMFANPRNIATGEPGWAWREGTALVDATTLRYDGERYYRIDRIATARHPVATSDNAVVGKFAALDEAVVRDGNLQAAVLRFTPDNGRTCRLLAGAATRLDDGLSVAPGDWITLIGEARQLGEAPFIVATDVTISRR